MFIYLFLSQKVYEVRYEGDENVENPEIESITVYRDDLYYSTESELEANILKCNKNNCNETTIIKRGEITIDDNNNATLCTKMISLHLPINLHRFIV